MELLLRHAIQYCDMRGSAALLEPDNISSIERFVRCARVGLARFRCAGSGGARQRTHALLREY